MQQEGRRTIKVVGSSSEVPLASLSWISIVHKTVPTKPPHENHSGSELLFPMGVLRSSKILWQKEACKPLL